MGQNYTKKLTLKYQNVKKSSKPQFLGVLSTPYDTKPGTANRLSYNKKRLFWQEFHTINNNHVPYKKRIISDIYPVHFFNITDY